MNETTPKVSMDPKAQFVGQAGVYRRLLDNGPLTDRKIKAYQAKGYFTNGFNDPRLRLKEEVKTKREAKTKRRTVEQILSDYE